MTAEATQTGRHKEPDPKYMTFVEHLDELRRRLIVSMASILVGSIIGWFLTPRILHLLEQPLRKYHLGKITVLTVYGGFTLNLKIAIMVGFVIALPVTVYQLWGFVAPAFGPSANRWAPLWITSALVLFIAGATTGYLVVPLAISFFAKFQSSDVAVIISANEYIGFIALILIVFGISFELPQVLVSLTAAGITSSSWLASKRLIAFFALFIFATVATPGADWVSPLILGSILYVLYEASILVSRLIGK